MYQLSRIIYYSRFFQRIESIFLFIWIFASVVTVSATFYIALSSYCRAFQINNHRPLLLPFAFLTFVISYLPSDIAEIIEIHVKYIRQFSIFILYLIPVVVLLFALILKKKGDNASASE